MPSEETSKTECSEPVLTHYQIFLLTGIMPPYPMRTEQIWRRVILEKND